MREEGGKGEGEGGGVKLRRTLTQSLTLVSNIPILLHIYEVPLCKIVFYGQKGDYATF